MRHPADVLIERPYNLGKFTAELINPGKAEAFVRLYIQTPSYNFGEIRRSFVLTKSEALTVGTQLVRQSLWTETPEEDQRTFQPLDWVKHQKGSIYCILNHAKCSETEQPMYVYSNVITGEIWVRPASEVEDGRFTLVHQGA